MRISASLVLYHNAQVVFEAAIQSYLAGIETGELVVVDNSSEPLDSALFAHERVRHVFTGQNIGFGAGHNRAYAERSVPSDVHLYLNPDVVFQRGVLPYLLNCFESAPEVGAIMPKVLYESGDLQPLAKLLPTPIDLIFRRFVPIKALRDRINARYELHALRHDVPIETPSLSGCFLLVRCCVIDRIGGFDTRYFMYMEDVDLVRRIGSVSRTLYEPRVHVTHGYAKGSYQNPQLLGYHLKSAVAYFMKWGWVFDRSRSLRNRRTLARLARRPD